MTDRPCWPINCRGWRIPEDSPGGGCKVCLIVTAVFRKPTFNEIWHNVWSWIEGELVLNSGISILFCQPSKTFSHCDWAAGNCKLTLFSYAILLLLPWNKTGVLSDRQKASQLLSLQPNSIVTSTVNILFHLKTKFKGLIRIDEESLFGFGDSGEPELVTHVKCTLIKTVDHSWTFKKQFNVLVTEVIIF